MMKLYLISQEENNDYDTYDSAVVAADSEKDASLIHPDGSETETESRGYYDWSTVDKIKAVYIGEATEGTERGVICASFNAG